MSDAATKRLPTRAAVIAGILLALPVVALLAVGTYAKAKPELWGFPFFFWYQFAWVFLASICTYAAYLLIERARAGGDDG